MGYGSVDSSWSSGLVLAFAVNDSVESVNLYAVGLIMAGVGVVVIALAFFTLNSSRRSRTVASDDPRRRQPDRAGAPQRDVSHRLTPSTQRTGSPYISPSGSLMISRAPSGSRK